MPGGVIVELEIAMPQFRYVTQIQQMVRRSCDPNAVIAIAALHAPDLMIFAAEPGSGCNQQKPSALSRQAFN